jgi:predicted restriction endonuclease
MTPIDRLRLEKAASDCGFEMTPLVLADGVELRSARFPETVTVRMLGERQFVVGASDRAIFPADLEQNTVAVDDYRGLYDTLRAMSACARTRPNRVAEAFKRVAATLPRGTEAERLVVQRVGQEMFRAALLDYWQGRCCISGLDVPELLRASHIRPWAQCETDEQRLDVFNGLLLAPHLDALFDTGLMTVLDDGAVRCADSLTPVRRRQLGLSEAMAVRSLRSEHRGYLRFHRDHVWRD